MAYILRTKTNWKINKKVKEYLKSNIYTIAFELKEVLKQSIKCINSYLNTINKGFVFVNLWMWYLDLEN